MDIRQAEIRLESFRASIGKLRGARKAIAESPAGVAALDEAIRLHEEAALELAEEIAAADWWDQGDIPALAGLIPKLTELVGAADGGPAVRLAQRVGHLCRPYNQRGAA